MEITTMLNALIDSHGRIPGIFMEKRTRQHYRIRSWFAKRDKRQREEIAELSTRVADAKLNALLDQAKIDRLQKQLSTERSLVNNAPVWAEMGNCPPDTMIAIRFEQIIKWQDEITRLQLRITTLERIMERETEKATKAGMP